MQATRQTRREPFRYAGRRASRSSTAWPEYLAAARKTMDTDAFAQFEQACREMYDQMARIAITPRWVRYYDFGAGRIPRFLQELAERS